MIEQYSCRTKSIIFIGSLIFLVVTMNINSVAAEDAKPTTSLDAQQVFAKASPAVVKIRIYSKTGRALSTGSGFFIDATGTIVTNYHVIENAGAARVDIPKQPSLTVTKIIALDKQSDLAIIKVDGKNLPFLKLSEALPKVGEKVFAIGSPHGLTNTLSDGLISGLRLQGKMTLIQTSAPISHGSSGGPLLSSEGVVLGVTTSGIIKGENLGFVVPAERVTRLIKNPNAVSQIARKLVKPPDVEAAETPKVYASLKALLSEIPLNRMPLGNTLPSLLRRTLLNKWATDNVRPGTRIGFTGKFLGTFSSGTNVKTLYLRFSESPVYIHGRKGILETTAAFDGRFVDEVLKLTSGTMLTIHGKMQPHSGGEKHGPLLISWYKREYRSRNYGYYKIRLLLTDCAFGRIPLPKKNQKSPKPTSRPATRKRTDEDKARSQVALAKSYIAAGLKVKATSVLKGIIAKYPKTQAAKTAATELEELDKK